MVESERTVLWPKIPCQWWYTWCHLNGNDGERYFLSFLIFAGHFEKMDSFGVMPLVAKARGKPIVYGIFSVEDVNKKRTVFKERTDFKYMFRPPELHDNISVALGDDWEMIGVHGGDGGFLLRASALGYECELACTFSKPLITLSEKQEGKKDFSALWHVYPRLSVTGTIKSGDKVEEVAGDGWLEVALEESLPRNIAFLNYDWIYLLFDDGFEIFTSKADLARWTFFPNADGFIVHSKGSAEFLYGNDIEMTSFGARKSPKTGVFYPEGWSIRSKKFDIDVVARSMFIDREIEANKGIGIRYWQCGCDISKPNDNLSHIGIGFAGSGRDQRLLLKAIRWIGDRVYLI